MEAFDEYVLPTLQRLDQYIPPSVAVQAASYLTLANTYFQSLRDTYAEPYVLSPLNAMLNSPPDLFSIFILFLIFVISLKILDYARRVITFWVVLIFRLVFWGLILGGGWYVYSVGWERSSRDAAWVLGLAEGFIKELQAANGNRGNGRGAK